MSKIKNTKQFKERVDAAFATMQTRDEAKPDLKAEGRLKAATRRLNFPHAAFASSRVCIVANAASTCSLNCFVDLILLMACSFLIVGSAGHLAPPTPVHCSL